MTNKTALALAIALTMTVPLAAKPFHHPFGEWREYNQDWLSACPDKIDEKDTGYYGVSCFASTGTVEVNAVNFPVYKLTLFLNRLTGVLDVAFTAAATDGTELDPSRPLLIKFGGEPAISLDFSKDLETRYNTINQYYPADPARRDALIEAMKSRNAVSMTVPITGGAKDSVDIRMSMRGVAASLDFMQSYSRKIDNY
ncbi:hypothetical protein [Devosia sp.]|uniref:hypothetical protein n=1 Tax=Devosia sp. TaxID=1871048 RepID=UPI003263D6D0